MAILPLQLPPGIVRGANPDDAPDRWYDGNLIRWRDGVMEPVGGWSRITSSPLGSTPRKIYQWRRNNNLAMMLVGCENHLFADDSGKFTNVAPYDLNALTTTSVGGFGTGTYGSLTYGTPRPISTNLTPTATVWSISAWGEDALAVASSDGRLFYYTSGNPGVEVKTVGEFGITAISRVSNVVTVTTNLAHRLSSGDAVSILDVPVPSFNTTSVPVTVTNDLQFTFAQTGPDASWSVTDAFSSGQAKSMVGNESGFALDFTDNSYAIGYTARVRDISVPRGNRAVLVTPERHVLLLQADGQPRRVAWSSREDYTDWNFASATNTAGYLDLQTETPLLSMCAVREGTLIWSANRAFLLRYVGQPFVYGADELGSTNLYAPNAFAELDGRAVWMDKSGFSLYEGGVVRPLPCPLTDYVFSNIDPDFGPRVVHASVNGKFDEVWFFYPSNGSQECDRILIWNYVDDWWSMGTLGRTAAFPSGVNTNPLMAGSDKHIYLHEDGWMYDGFDCANNVYVASGTLNLPGDEANWAINQVIPSNGGNYNLTKYTFFTRQTPNGAERTFGPYYSRSDGYVDTRVSGRDVRVRICANAAGDWSIGRLRLKVGTGGARR